MNGGETQGTKFRSIYDIRQEGKENEFKRK